MMSVGKSVLSALGVTLLGVALIAGCEGDEGPAGPRGFTGRDGDPGADRGAKPIAAQNFGLMITNGTDTDFQGAFNVQLTSDPTAAPANNRVVARELTTPPVIDGVDGGIAEWGDAVESNIAIASLFGSDLGINSISLSVGYDLKYVYVRAKWTEVETGAFQVRADTTAKMWSLSGTNWTRSAGEDRLYLMWELSDIAGWQAQGAATIFDGVNFRTNAAGESADLWIWQSTVTYYYRGCADYVVRFADTDGLQMDAGVGFAMENEPLNNRPSYMKANSSKAGSNYPLRSFEYTAFVNAFGWQQGARIPGYVFFAPAGSSADIEAAARFTNGTWVVELRRLRNTGNNDDKVL